eukprot:6199883-Pleurochrysis_carterae.AAC.4
MACVSPRGGARRCRRGHVGCGRSRHAAARQEAVARARRPARERGRARQKVACRQLRALAATGRARGAWRGRAAAATEVRPVRLQAALRAETMAGLMDAIC